MKLKEKTAKKPGLTTHLQMGATTLNVTDLGKMEQFYKDIVGLEIINKTKDSVSLGFKDREIIKLEEAAELPPEFMLSAGLYHNAIVYSSRGQLALVLERILRDSPESYSGTADHLVSEAFYFTDPEGNGLELYYDRDPSTWQWENGRVKMAAIYIDPAEYIAKYKNDQEAAEKHMGHVHLKVGDIEQAKRFYVSVLGFEITAELPTALFVSINGYHHHLGMNVWESYGAGKREASLGLKSFELILSSQQDVEALEKRLKNYDILSKRIDNTLYVSDPWNNQSIFKVSDTKS